MQAGHLQPLTEEVFLHTGLCLEDGQRNGPDGNSVSVKLLMEILERALSQPFDIGTPFHFTQKSTLAPTSNLEPIAPI